MSEDTGTTGTNQGTGIAIYSMKVEKVTHELVKVGKTEMIFDTVHLEGGGVLDGQWSGPTIGFWLTAGERICVHHGKQFNLQPAMGCEGGYQCPLCEGGMLWARRHLYRAKKSLDQLYADMHDAIWTKVHPNIGRDENDFIEYQCLGTSNPDKIVRISDESFGGKRLCGMQVIVKAGEEWKPIYSLGALVPENEKEDWLNRINWTSWEGIAYLMAQNPGGLSDMDGWVIDHVAKDKDGTPLILHDMVKMNHGQIGEITQVSAGTLIVMPRGKGKSSTTARPEDVVKVVGE